MCSPRKRKFKARGAEGPDHILENHQSWVVRRRKGNEQQERPKERGEAITQAHAAAGQRNQGNGGVRSWAAVSRAAQGRKRLEKRLFVLQ